MPDFNAQNTDAENDKALAKSTEVESGLRSRNIGSAQSIAQTKENLGGYAGGGGENPGANVQAGK